MLSISNLRFFYRTDIFFLYASITSQEAVNDIENHNGVCNLDTDIHICRIYVRNTYTNVLSNNRRWQQQHKVKQNIRRLVGLRVFALTYPFFRSFLYSSELPSQLIQVTIVNKSYTLLFFTSR